MTDDGWDLSDFSIDELLNHLDIQIKAAFLFGGPRPTLPAGATAPKPEFADSRFIELWEVSNKEIFAEVVARFDTQAEQAEKLRTIVIAAARIAFGDYTELPRIKLLFNDVGVYGTSAGQLSFLLDQ